MLADGEGWQPVQQLQRCIDPRLAGGGPRLRRGLRPGGYGITLRRLERVLVLSNRRIVCALGKSLVIGCAVGTKAGLRRARLRPGRQLSILRAVRTVWPGLVLHPSHHSPTRLTWPRDAFARS